MTDTPATSAHDLLEQILAQSKDLLTQGKAQSADLTAKGKDIAKRGEDILVDKLGLDDTEVSRDALRKGVGAGAAAGALALLLSRRSGRKLATLGGLGALGVLAFKAHQAGKIPTSMDDVVGLLKGEPANQRAEILLRAMVAAAKADGHISEDERAIIDAHKGAGNDALEAILQEAPNPSAIAALATDTQSAIEIYAISARVANGLNPKERDYLDRLAMAMKLDPDMAAKVETQVRTG